MTQLDVVRDAAIRLGMPIALDSSALIALLVNERPVGQLVAGLANSQARLALSAIVISEALVRTARLVDRSFLESIALSLQAQPAFHILPFGAEQVVETAIIRAETRLKFPDAAIVATARMAGAIAIVGNDRAWQTKPLGIQYIHLDDVLREAQMEQEPS